MSGQAHSNSGSIDDRQAQRWIAMLKDGAPAEKAQARRGLAGVFEAREMYAEAVELLVANAREGHRDAEQFRTLARLYRQLGDEYLSTAAALEATRLGAGDSPSRPPTSPPPGRGHRRHGLGGRPEPSRHTWDDEPDTSDPGDHPADPTREPGPRQANTRRTAPASASSATRARGKPGPSWRTPLRVLGWLVVAGLMIGAAAVGGRSPATAVLYMVSAVVLAVLLSGSPTLRRLIFVPDGPLGDGALLFSWLLTLLSAGALLPRDQSSVFTPTPGPAPTLTPIPTLSVFPRGTGPTASPAPAPTRSPAPSPVTGRVASPVAQSGGATRAGSSRTSRRGAASLALATATVPPPAAPQPAAVSTNAPLMLVVIRGGTDGVLLRDAPGTGDVVKVLANGTELQARGVERKDSGRTWRLVRDGTGAEGWIAAEYLAVESVLAPDAQAMGTPTRTAFQPAYAGSAAARPSTSGDGRAAPGDAVCPATHPIEASHSPSGEPVYHPDQRAVPPSSTPETCFATEADARAAGFRASQR